MRLPYKVGVAAFTLLSGCASQSWQHSLITDPAQATKQLTADDAYCTLLGYGAAPMPDIVAAPQPTTTYVNGQVRTYNTTTGQTSYGTYTGTATTGASGGFGGGMASGMASGMSMGAAIAAAQTQDLVKKTCMVKKGWNSVPSGTAINAGGTTSVPASALPHNSTAPALTTDIASIYPTPESEWYADMNEFLWFFPDYRFGAKLDSFDSQVRKYLAAGVAGPLALMTAHEDLVAAKRGAPAPTGAAANFYKFYSGAVAGAPLDQATFGYMNSTGLEGLPKNQQRAVYWAQKSAQAGSPNGQLLYGDFLFNGNGIKANRVVGYSFVKKAAAKDKDARDVLREMEKVMTPTELSAVK